MDAETKKLFQSFHLALENQNKLIERLMLDNNGHSSTSSSSMNTESIMCGISSQIKEFIYDPEENLHFQSWFKRYEGLFMDDAKQLDDQSKVRLILRKIDTSCHEKYINIILPKKISDFSFDETVKKLSDIFGPSKTIFHRRFECIQVTKEENEDYISYAGRINRHCESFDINKITSDEFKCLIFVCGLKSPAEAEIRTRLLSTISSDKERKLTIDDLLLNCQNLQNLKQDTRMIEKGTNHVHAVTNNNKNYTKKDFKQKNINQQSQCKQSNSKSTKDIFPKSPCWGCGDMHFYKSCPFSSHTCTRCKKTGHKEGFCNCFKKNLQDKKKPAHVNTVFSLTESTVDATNRKYVEIQINGRNVNMQLDSCQT